MITLISCAKTMKPLPVKVPEVTQPVFQSEASRNALAIMQFSKDQLEKLLHVNSRIAAENYLRYREFHAADMPLTPALCTYTGAVFKRIAPVDFTSDDFLFSNNHLLITSFLYGLLRPLDGIRMYRLEGNVRLHEGKTMFDFWKPLLTAHLIKAVKDQGGVLVNLASAEMKDLFFWDKVEESVRVVTPDFQVWKGEQLKTVVMYAKMCRGEMVRYILKKRIEDSEELRSFEWEGFRLDASRSDRNHFLFTM